MITKQDIEAKILDKQFYKCANKNADANIPGLAEHKCPLWDSRNRGVFRDEDYKFVRIKHSYSVALCNTCYDEIMNKRSKPEESEEDEGDTDASEDSVKSESKDFNTFYDKNFKGVSDNILSGVFTDAFMNDFNARAINKLKRIRGVSNDKIEKSISSVSSSSKSNVTDLQESHANHKMLGGNKRHETMNITDYKLHNTDDDVIDVTSEVFLEQSRSTDLDLHIESLYDVVHEKSQWRVVYYVKKPSIITIWKYPIHKYKSETNYNIDVSYYNDILDVVAVLNDRITTQSLWLKVNYNNKIGYVLTSIRGVKTVEPFMADGHIVFDAGVKKEKCDKAECSICLDSIEHKIVLVSCGHTRFCSTCIDALLTKTCPICMQTFEKYIRVYD